MRTALLLALLWLMPISLAPAASVYREVNPDRLSGGLYAALEEAGGLETSSPPPRARASYPDLAKGRPPAVLEARVGVNVRLGDDPDALPAGQRGQVEPHIVRSSTRPELLLATFQEGRYFDAGAINCGYAVSADGGLTWRRALTPRLTTSTGGRFNRATDPVAGAGPQGDLYLQALASAQGAFSLAAVVVSRSSDGGATWSDPATVYESNTSTIGPDKNWLAVNDYPDVPNSGRLVSTWTQFLRAPNGTTISSPLVASLSDDRGVTWTAPTQITPQASNHQGSIPLFLPDGSLAVVYITFLDTTNVTRFSIQCKRSADGGRTFPSTAATVVPFVQGWDDPDLRDGIFLPSAAVARQTGELFVSYTAMVGNTPRIHVTRSTDQGATWSPPVIVSDQPEGISVMNPVVAADPFGTSVSVIFTDKRLAPDGRNFVDHYAALYRGSDRTWLPNVRLSTTTSDIRFGPATARGVMLGDYLGLAPPTDNEPFVAIWCDTRTGDADPFTVRFTPYRPLSGGGDPVLPYTDWTIARFSAAERTRGADAPEADPDGDGASNLEEFALGTDPRSPESGEAAVLSRLSAAQTQIGLALATGRGDTRAALLLPSASPGSPARKVELVAALPPAGAILPPGLEWRAAAIDHSASAPLIAALEFTHGFQRLGTFSTFTTPARETPATGTDARLVNLSTRGRSGTAHNQMIVGFVLDGPKTVLVRAAGPALASLGVTGILPDPRLTLSAPASDLSRVNDNWQQGDATAALFTRVGALPFAPNSLDAALALQLGAQNVTAIAADTAGRTGVALIEVYDTEAASPTLPASRLLNLSTRGETGAGESALIAGFVLSGSQPRRVLLRAVGPGLAAFGLTGTLTDPVLTVFRGNTAISTNDDWELSRSSLALALTAQRVGAFPLDRSSRDAALLLTLPPGPYTALVSSADGSTGLVLVEVYDAD